MDRSILVKVLVAVVVGVFLGFIAGRQQQILKNQDEVLREIRELRKSSAFRPAPAELDMSIEGAAIKGSASVTVIEFSDFECPYCGRYVKESFPRLERDYINTGRIQYVFRHFPLVQIHPRAMKAGEAAECARRQGKFWPLHDRLFANRKALDPSALLDHARAVGLDMTAFEPCLNGEATDVILADLKEGGRVEVEATPTFFFGLAQKDGSVRVVEKLSGAKPYAEFQTILDRMLASEGSGR